MIKKPGLRALFSIAFILAAVLFLMPAKAYSQFMNFNLRIESKITTTAVQRLTLGTYPINSGRVDIRLGSSNMGIFNTMALENQTVLISVTKPASLTPNDFNSTDQIPLTLNARYGYSRQNYQQSLALKENQTAIKIKPADTSQAWNTLYIFLFGSINIGQISSNIYSGEVSLTVEYI